MSAQRAPKPAQPHQARAETSERSEPTRARLRKKTMSAQRAPTPAKAHQARAETSERSEPTRAKRPQVPPGSNSEVRPLLRLAIPIVVTQLGQMLLGTIDTVIAGRLSVRALDAVALGNVWQVGTMMPLVGVIMGLDPLVSQAHGAGRGEDAGLGLQRALLIAALLALALVGAWSYTAEGLVLLGQDPELARLAAVFVGVQRFSVFGPLAYGGLSVYLVSRGVVRPGILVMVLANLFNATAGWALTFGALGLPALGIHGLGLSTGLTRLLLLASLALITFGFGLHEGAWTPWSARVFERTALRRQLALGLPTGLTLALELWAFQFGTVVAGRIDHVALGAHAIALNLSALSFMVPLGFSIGTSARVGQLVGAGESERAQRAANTALKLIASYSSCAGLLFVVGRSWLPELYASDPEIIASAASVLPIAGAFQLVDGLQAAASGVLRGMGRPRETLLFNLLGYFALAIPLAYYTGLHTQLRLRGVWLGYAAGLAFVAVGLVWRVLRHGPRTVKPIASNAIVAPT
jgi:multidrug resistance protein, MATE family